MTPKWFHITGAVFVLALTHTFPSTLSAKSSKPLPSTKAGTSTDKSGERAVHRTVIHTEAYKKRKGLGPHVSIKITPPEKRGRKGRVLVEVYNFSKTYINVADFYLVMTSDWGDRIEVNISVDDIKPNWSALKWVQIPGNKPIPPITNVEIKNLVTYDQRGRKTNLKYYTDLIKE